ncbi:hypothetical protein MRX96_019428 [Rhipicephalus microplus]
MRLKQPAGQTKSHLRKISNTSSPSSPPSTLAAPLELWRRRRARGIPTAAPEEWNNNAVQSPVRTRAGRSTCSGHSTSCSADHERFRSTRGATSASDSDYVVFLPHGTTLLTMGQAKATLRKPTRCPEQARLRAGIQLASVSRRRLLTLISTSCIFPRKSG